MGDAVHRYMQAMPLAALAMHLEAKSLAPTRRANENKLVDMARTGSPKLTQTGITATMAWGRHTSMIGAAPKTGRRLPMRIAEKDGSRRKAPQATLDRERTVDARDTAFR